MYLLRSRQDSLASLLGLALLIGCDNRGAEPVSSVLGEPPHGSSSVPVLPSSVAQLKHDVSRPMMIRFTRDFCLPCQIMAPAIDQLRRDHAASVDIVDVNIDRENNERFAIFFQVSTVPTQFFVDATGRIVSINEGMATKEELEQEIRRLGWVP